MVGVTIDGIPPGIPLDVKDLEPDLSRRKSGAAGTTPRIETDLPNIVSGVYKGKTSGSPVTILFDNQNIESKDYSQFEEIPRPGHADFVAMKKFGDFNDKRGGGHFSGRITIGLVAAGTVAKKIIHPLNIYARLVEAGGNANIEKAVKDATRSRDSIGGIVECVASNMPVGLGEPFFDSVESVISHLAFSVPAIKGIEFGAGFAAARMTGSEHNDWITDLNGTTETNHAGGINGGISNGNDLVFKVVVKPTSSTSQVQKTINIKTGKREELKVEGRHDTCIALRIPVIIEAITAIALADLLLVDRGKRF
jgi:chorismate synthase